MVAVAENIKVPELRFSKFEGSWEERRLGKLVKTFSGGTPKSSVPSYYLGEIPFIQSGEIGESVVRKHITPDAIEKSSAKLIQSGDLLLALYGATAGESALSPINGAINQAVLCIRSSMLDSIFLNNWLKANKGDILATYLQGGQGNLSAGIVKQLEVTFPSLSEQQKIAEFLTSVDERIAKLKRKKELLEEYKKGMMQKLFSQEVRFKDEDGNDFPDWEEISVGAMISPIKTKSSRNNQYPVLTSSRSGLYFQKDYYNKQVASEDNTGYNVVPFGCFTYRHMSDDLVFRFNLNTICENGIVSTLYPVFKAKQTVDSGFLEIKLNEGEEFKRFSLRLKQGGSRTYMYLNKLCRLSLQMPQKEEQIRINGFIRELDAKIECSSHYIEKAQEFKRGLLQKMFI